MTTFIISKKSVNLELFIDGKIEVRPLSGNGFSEETVELLAQMHQAFLSSYLKRHEGENPVEVAVRYFKNKGFELKENEIPPSETL